MWNVFMLTQEVDKLFCDPNVLDFYGNTAIHAFFKSKK